MTPNVKGKGMKNGRLMLCIKTSESVELKMREQTSACSSRPITNRIIAIVIIFSFKSYIDCKIKHWLREIPA